MSKVAFTGGAVEQPTRVLEIKYLTLKVEGSHLSYPPLQHHATQVSALVLALLNYHTVSDGPLSDCCLPIVASKHAHTGTTHMQSNYVCNDLLLGRSLSSWGER